MKSGIIALMALLFSSTFALGVSPWEGMWSAKEDNGLSGTLKIDHCQKKTCHFDLENHVPAGEGGGTHECDAGGRLTLKTPTGGFWKDGRCSVTFVFDESKSEISVESKGSSDDCGCGLGAYLDNVFTKKTKSKK